MWNGLLGTIHYIRTGARAGDFEGVLFWQVADGGPLIVGAKPIFHAFRAKIRLKNFQKHFFLGGGAARGTMIYKLHNSKSFLQSKKVKLQFLTFMNYCLLTKKVSNQFFYYQNLLYMRPSPHSRSQSVSGILTCYSGTLTKK